MAGVFDGQAKAAPQRQWLDGPSMPSSSVDDNAAEQRSPSAASVQRRLCACTVPASSIPRREGLFEGVGYHNQLSIQHWFTRW